MLTRWVKVVVGKGLKHLRVYCYCLPHVGLATTPHPFHCLCMRPRGGVHKTLAVVHCVVNIIHPWKSRQNDSGVVGGLVGLCSVKQSFFHNKEVMCVEKLTKIIM